MVLTIAPGKTIKPIIVRLVLATVLFFSGIAHCAESEVEHLAQILGLKPGASVADVGAGSARFRSRSRSTWNPGAETILPRSIRSYLRRFGAVFSKPGRARCFRCWVRHRTPDCRRAVATQSSCGRFTIILRIPSLSTARSFGRCGRAPGWPLSISSRRSAPVNRLRPGCLRTAVDTEFPSRSWKKNCIEPGSRW